MHNKLPRIYYFINKFDKKHINSLKPNIALIYRNYDNKLDKNLILKIKKYCKNNNRKFFLANNYKIALKLNLDGVYLPSFNKDLDHLNYPKKRGFFVLGSAHNVEEIRVKTSQKVDALFLASLFNKKKTFLGFNRFKILLKYTKSKVIALGGINKKNLKKISLLNVYGYAAISFFEQKKSP